MGKLDFKLGRRVPDFVLLTAMPCPSPILNLEIQGRVQAFCENPCVSMTLCGVDMLALLGEMGHSVYHLLQEVYPLWKICLQKEGLAAEI